MLLGPSLRPQEDRVGLCQLLKWPGEKPNSRKANRLFEVEAAARFECSKGRRCGENTLGERVKGIGKWRDIENVQKLDKVRSEGWKLGMRSLISTQKRRTSYKRDRILIEQSGKTN